MFVRMLMLCVVLYRRLTAITSHTVYREPWRRRNNSVTGHDHQEEDGGISYGGVQRGGMGGGFVGS